MQRLRKGTGALSTAALQRMDERLPWYRAMDPEDRSWVGLIAQAGIAAFIAWYKDPEHRPGITADVFGTAPRELTRSISLQQTLEMVRTVVDVVEDRVGELAAPGTEQELRESVLRYSRDVAFAAAEIYARAAEARGAWDARLEALVVDALIRDEAGDALHSQAAALGWQGSDQVVVVVGTAADGHSTDIVDDLRRTASRLGADALIGVQGERIVTVLGRSEDPLAVARDLAPRFGPGPVVTGPVVTGLVEAGSSARAALAGMSSVRAWPGAPRPVCADELLPERLLDGDGGARSDLIERAFRRLADEDGPLLETAATYLELGRSVEAAARALFIHPNTVRYRLNRVTSITGWDPTDPREGFVLQIAIAVGRLASRTSGA